MKRSNVSWTDFSGGDANFVIRGRVVGDCEASRGCANCYAASILRRNSSTPEHTTKYPDKLARLARAKFEPGDTPFRRGPGSRPLVFVCDMGDLFHESVPGAFIVDALNVMTRRADVDWQVLTKRPGRMAFIAKMYGWPKNVWAGVTVEDQRVATERIPLLLQVPARVRFLSCEPLLECVDFNHCSAWNPQDNAFYLEGIHWVIVGGESGPRRRVFSVEWARSLRDQCKTAGVAFFYKQGGHRFPGREDELDGRTWKEFPS